MNIIKLNVGGKKFCTLEDTLLRSENCYFHGLLSGKFQVPMTDEGEYFIDRNGDAFEVILEYLRSQHLLFNGNVPITLVRSEAQYYSLVGVVEAIDEYIEKKGVLDSEEIPIPREDGFYTNNKIGSDCKAFHFRGDGKLCFFEGEYSRNNALVFHMVRIMPDLWKNHQETVDAFATFYQSFLKRGFYEVQGSHFSVKLSQDYSPLPGICASNFILLPRFFEEHWEKGSFERYSFVPFNLKQQ